MFEKVLIVEDHESISKSLLKILQELRISEVDNLFYCDDALAKIKTAKLLNRPYDLLISDLHFDEDGLVQEIKGGLELIAAARIIQPELRILVFSADIRPAILDTLYSTLKIDGYVRKARNDSRELEIALQQMAENKQYLPRSLGQLISKKNLHEFSNFDIAIISLLASGIPQKNIPAHLAEKNMRPSGLSSVEKRLNHMRTTFEFSTNEQLVAFCKDMGII